MSDLIEQHLSRIRAATTHRMTRRDLAQWVEEKTTINGRPFSFRNHEYQQRIMSDESQEIVVRKCSQVGLSEMAIRMALGLVGLMEYYSLIYTFPTATFASTYVKTRVDPVIAGSPYLRHAVSNSVDSSEVKQVGDNFLYFKGAQSGNAAISVAADHLIHDELDFSDQTIVDQYQSRLTHSPHKNKLKLSTPTLPRGPIDAAFTNSRRHWLFVKCNHCNHQFIPDYYEHVKIPDSDIDLRMITKETIHALRWQDAALRCPKCGGVPSLLPQHREWVCENPGEAHMAVGYQVQPFDAPNLITVPYLVQASTQYRRRIDFDNFNLGRPAEDAESGLTPSDMDKAGVEMLTTPFVTHVIGADMGITCRLAVGGVGPEGEVIAVHTEEVNVGKFKQRYLELCQEYRVTAKVLDSQPYVETVMALQERDPGLFGAFFVRKEKLELYDVSTREENIAAGKTAMRQVQINRNKALDMLMEAIKTGRFLVRKDANWDKVKAQCTDMKRTRMLTTDGEFSFVWVKSPDKNDHFHHAFLYMWVATLLRGVDVHHTAGIPMAVHKFKLLTEEQKDAIRRGVL